VAALTLFERGKFRFEDDISVYLPQFSELSMLKPGSKDPDDTIVAPRAPTVRELFCHNGGFSYGIFMESVVDQKYTAARVLAPDASLSDLAERVAALPLANAPGARWQYSVSTDLLARLIEVWAGESFADYLERVLFRPLGMTDTGFQVRADQVERFAANYVPVDPMDPMKPGLNLAPDTVLGNYLQPRALQSGGGGLVSTLADYTRFIQMIVNDGELNGVRILKPDTVALMRSNALPGGLGVELPNWRMPNTVFGHGFAIKTAPATGEPDTAIDEYHWGGLAGTHSWISPRGSIAGIIFTQRLPGFWHPFSHEFKREVYRIAR
jgi:CubicO group peptidase (beta-lactamase class C family)